jgi:hypothetical protein
MSIFAPPARQCSNLGGVKKEASLIIHEALVLKRLFFFAYAIVQDFETHVHVVDPITGPTLVD